MLIKPFVILVIFCFGIACARNAELKNAAPLTESMGQEVIEIGSPVKALPADVDEEPSAEVDDDVTTIPPATKKSERKSMERSRDSNKIDDEDARIEKELSEIYKDNADYKGDMDTGTSTKTSKTTQETTKTTKLASKESLRAKDKDEFHFQPQVYDRQGIEKFRTSIDEISCDKVPLVATKMIDLTTKSPGSDGGDKKHCFTGFIYIIALMSLIQLY